MSIRDQEQNELGAFLRARRSELSTSDVDLPEGGRQRRVAGLRREEVAQLAAISTDYYTRLARPDPPVRAGPRVARTRPAARRRPANLDVRARGHSSRHEVAARAAEG